MELAILKVDSGTGIKDILIVGEIHIYGDKESKLAKRLLEIKKIDHGFFEGVDVAGFFGFLFKLFFKSMKFITRRNKKTLVELVIEKNIPFKRLEEGQLPMSNRIGLSLLILVFFWIVLKFVLSIFTQEWHSVIRYAIAISVAGFTALKLPYSNPSLFSFVSRYLPVNKEERDRIMAFNLVKYIKELYFKTGLVVVGVAHFPQMVTAIKDNFECQLVDPK